MIILTRWPMLRSHSHYPHSLCELRWKFSTTFGNEMNPKFVPRKARSKNSLFGVPRRLREGRTLCWGGVSPPLSRPSTETPSSALPPGSPRARLFRTRPIPPSTTMRGFLDPKNSFRRWNLVPRPTVPPRPLEAASGEGEKRRFQKGPPDDDLTRPAGRTAIGSLSSFRRPIRRPISNVSPSLRNADVPAASPVGASA